MNHQNYTLLCDFYEITMANGYFLCGKAEEEAVFDMFFRDIPDDGGFAIAAGLEQLIEYIKNIQFTDEDIAYLQSKQCFDARFLEYLKTFRFTGDIYAIPEGTPIFPGEPIVTVKAPAAQAQFIETFLLLCINHQSLIATKANRLARAAQGRPIAEFGSRRAQGADAAVLGARAAYIGGCVATACTLSDREYHVPATGTMAHSWVQMFDDEYEAFATYCRLYPHNATLLVDTYDVLKSGIPNAIRAFQEILLPQGITSCGIRLDSGDITYLTKKARRMLDDAGLTSCKIVVSNSLDEYIIHDIISQGACVDSFGVGERLITARSEPVFGGVYKLVAKAGQDGTLIPKIKISENPGKITNPHFKKVYRIYDKQNGKAIADYITIYDEPLDTTRPLELFDPENTWKRQTVTDYTARALQIPVFLKGQCVYQSPAIEDIQKYCQEEIETLWDEVKRFENPHRYYVDLSQTLWDLKQEMLRSKGKTPNKKECKRHPCPVLIVSYVHQRRSEIRRLIPRPYKRRGVFSFAIRILKRHMSINTNFRPAKHKGGAIWDQDLDRLWVNKSTKKIKCPCPKTSKKYRDTSNVCSQLFFCDCFIFSVWCGKHGLGSCLSWFSPLFSTVLSLYSTLGSVRSCLTALHPVSAAGHRHYMMCCFG